MPKYFIMDKNFKPINIAVIGDNSISKVTFSNVGMVNEFNSQIIDYIYNDNGIGQDAEEWFRAGDIIGVCYHIIRWRRCTAYLVIQFSDIGVRNLCYFSDEIKHHAQCFGTSMESVDKNQVFKCIEENSKKFLENNKIMKVFLNSQRLILLEKFDNFKDLFGI